MPINIREANSNDLLILVNNNQALAQETEALELNKKYVPNKLFLGSVKASEMELLQEKFVQGTTMIYVCENKACQLPTTNIMKAQKLMK